MKTTTNTVFIALFLVVVCLVAFIVPQAQAQTDFTVTASLDHETYDAMSYIRFSIDKPQNLPRSLNGAAQVKLFDIQLPNAWSNIQDGFASCTRNSLTVDETSAPMFIYRQQTSESRGFELMYPSVFDRDTANFKTQLNCVIKIRAMPQYTGTNPKFTIKLLAATNIFLSGSSKVNTLNFSFVIPQLVTTATTSSRTFPQAHPFLYAKDKNPLSDADRDRFLNAPTTPDVYTTSLNIDQTLLALRKNNKLIITHPFPFEFVETSSFCTSPHEITPYDFEAQAPVTQASTESNAVTAISISLSSFSGSSNDISCQISVRPVLPAPVNNEPAIESYPAGRVNLFLEYSHYNKTGTSSFSNFYKTFISRTFEPIDPKTIFPSFDPAVILATPPIAKRHQLTLSPGFLDSEDSENVGFWNRYNIMLSTFAFEANQVLFVPQPDNLADASGLCLDDADGTNAIQVHNCLQLTAETSCPDFDFQLGIPMKDGAPFPAGSTGRLGLLLFPKRNLRFIHSDCYYNFFC